MRKLIYAINVTLDGYADHQAGIADAELHTFYADLLRTSDTILYGRVTYQLMASYWPMAPDLPTSTPDEIDFANEINRIQKIVFSKTLQKVEWSNSRLVRDDAAEEVIRLKSQPGKDIFVGGLTFAASLMDLGLIDEYWLAVHPILLGTGTLLTKDLHTRVDLKLMELKPFKSGVIAAHYQKID